MKGTQLPPGGFFRICKPAGPTSRDIVNRMVKLLGCRRVGHAGTLDPFAEGLLLVMWGRATRVITHLNVYTKTYRVVVEFGKTTDTQDITGTVQEVRSTDGLTRGAIEGALSEFVGDIYQRPPMFSAVRHQGRRLYHTARKGEVVERKPRLRHVNSLKLLSWQSPLAELEVECSTGTYVRTIAHDLGRRLGTGACTAKLKRTKIGPHSLDGALDGSFESLSGELRGQSLPASGALPDWPEVAIDDTEEQLSLAHGQWKDPRGIAADLSYCRLTDSGGRLLALGCGGRQPRLLNVFVTPEEAV